MNFIKKNREKIIALLFCLLVSLISLLFTSKNSFFYPFNDWIDANAFFTTGKAMMNGIVPFLDIFEQKGPLLYVIYGIGYLISNTTFIGVFILEVISWTAFLYFMFKIIKLFLNKNYGYIIIPIFCSIMCVSAAFVHGGSAEEFCLPFYSLTLYYFLKHFKNEEINYKELFIAGFGAGWVLTIKYTLLGFWFGFMAFIFFDLLINKKVKKAFISCLVFLLGMFIPMGIFLVYFTIVGGVRKYFEVYFLFNMTSYADITTGIVHRLINIGNGLITTLRYNNIVVFILIILMPILLIKLEINLRGKIFLLITFILSIIGIYWGLFFAKYYFLPIEVFMIISLIVIFYTIDRYIQLDKYKIFYILIMLISLFLVYDKANYKEMRFTDKNDLFQYKLSMLDHID